MTSNNSNKETTAIETAIQIALIAILGFWCFKIAQPFISPIIWAGIIAIGIYPVYLWLKNKLGLSAGWTSTIVTISLLVTLITPTLLLSGALIDNTQTLSEHIKNDQLNVPLPSESVAEWPLIGKKVHAFWTQLSNDPKEALGQYNTEIKKLGKWIISTAAGASLNILVFVFSIIIAGVFLVSGDAIKETFAAMFHRAAKGRGSEFTELSLSTVHSVVTGILGIALIQTILAGLGFIVMDIPAAGVLAFICLIMAIVQIDILLVLSLFPFMRFPIPLQVQVQQSHF